MTNANITTTTEMQMTGAPLGRTGPIVSRLGLGTMTFGVETDEAGASVLTKSICTSSTAGISTHP